jgi:hypothetical protein
VSLNQNIQIIRNTYFSGLGFNLPLFDIKIRRVADGHFIEQYRARFVGGEDNLGREAAYYRTTLYGVWYQNLLSVGGGAGGVLDQHFGRPVGNCLRPQIPYDTEGFVIIWNLPADNSPIPDSTPVAPAPGQRMVEITKDFCRVAKPGFDVRTATPTQFAFDSSRRPASVLKGGDEYLPAGTTAFELGFPVTANMVCDMILYDDVIVFPMSQYGRSLIAEYWFSGTKLFAYNAAGIPCRIRFLVMAFDSTPPTAGANKVFRQFKDGAEDVVQFLRPGAAANPSFADIVIDSRWPALQILAEGYQTIAGQPNYTPPNSVNPGQSFTVNFNNFGLFPFVKYTTLHIQGENGLSVKPASTFITENYNNQLQYHQGNSTYCVMSGSQATFWTFNGNPSLERTNQNNQWVMDYPPIRSSAFDTSSSASRPYKGSSHMAEYYTTGSVQLTNGSKSVTGIGTAWAIAQVAGGTIYVGAQGNALPLVSIESGTAAISALEWTGATGTYPYALLRATAFSDQLETNSNILSRLLVAMEAGTLYRYDATGDLAELTTYNERPEGFAFLAIDTNPARLYIKASAASGDWAGPFAYGPGPPVRHLISIFSRWLPACPAPMPGWS